MKTACMLAVLSCSGVVGFAPTTSFTGSAISTSSCAATGPQMLFNFGGKKPAPIKEAEQAANKLQSKGKQAVSKGKAAVGQAKQQAKAATPSKASATFKSKVAAPAKQAASSAKRQATSAAKSAPAPAKNAISAIKRTAQEVAQPGSASDFAIDFGSDVEAPFWDPAQLAREKPAETLEWYRAAELKHGRVAMLAALGTFVNAAGIALPDPVFQGTTKSFDALAKVAEDRPGALIQIVLAIAAVEVLSTSLPEGDYPGDYGFDPLKQLPNFEKRGEGDAIRLRELKNGRLAMVGIAGMWLQEALTQQGVFEQLASGHISPVNDGQGYF